MSNASSKSTETAVPQSKPSGASQPAWGPVSAVVISLLVFVVGFFVAGFVMYALAAVAGKTTQQTNDWLSSVTGQFVFVVLAEALVVGTVMIFLRQRKTSLRAVGYHRGPRFRDVGFALLGFVVYFVALIAATAIAQHAFHINVDQKQELGFDNVFTTGEKCMAFISLVILPPLAEETLFRGFLFTGLRKRLTFVWATIIVSLAFASLHLLESSQGILWIAGIDTFVLSMVLCYLREKTGNLWAGILVHGLKNTLAFTFLYLVGGSS